MNLATPALSSRPMLTLADVDRIAAAARNDWKVSIVVVDDGSHALSLQRPDGAAPISAAIGRRETKGYEDMIKVAVLLSSR
jgi:glc operon protein GlcG